MAYFFIDMIYFGYLLMVFYICLSVCPNKGFFLLLNEVLLRYHFFLSFSPLFIITSHIQIMRLKRMDTKFFLQWIKIFGKKTL